VVISDIELTLPMQDFDVWSDCYEGLVQLGLLMSPQEITGALEILGQGHPFLTLAMSGMTPLAMIAPSLEAGGPGGTGFRVRFGVGSMTIQ
jgi:hypothetical protein